MYVIDLSKKLDEFNQKINLEYYLQGSGRKETLEISPIYAQYQDIFTKEAVLDIKAKLSQAKDPETERRLRYLYSNIVSEYFHEKIKYLQEQIVAAESTANLKWDGQNVTYRYLIVLQGNEPDPSRRLELAKMQEEVVTKLNPLRLEKAELLRSLTKELGFETYSDLCSELRSFRLNELKVMMENFLQATAEIYAYWMDKKCSENLGLSLKKMLKHDVGYFLRAPHFDRFFTQGKAVDVVKSTLRGMGFDLEAQKNIEFDLDARPGKSPRAFCSPIDAPYDVKLVTMPQGGQADYQCLLHETGHAEHYGSVREDLEYEYKNLGDLSVTETYAFNLHYLTIEPFWLEDKLGLQGSDLREYLEQVVLNKLYMLRRFAAKLLYELDFHDGGVLTSKEERYSYYLGSHLKIKHSSCFYLADMDSGFYVAGYLRAWVLEAQLKNYLKNTFGDRWYSSTEAGNFMHDLYSLGLKYTADELAHRISDRGLTIRPLVQEFEKILG